LPHSGIRGDRIPHGALGDPDAVPAGSQLWIETDHGTEVIQCFCMPPISERCVAGIEDELEAWR
jgi:hypothetical protein